MNAPVKFHLAAIVMAAAVTSIAVAPAALASAPMRQLSGLHDARYCEIIELKGAPPSASATVWNTIGLNKCPAPLWRAFSAVALARELGDTFVVLNGPRYFLMDSVSADTGGVRAFHGLRARKVATIPIRTAADLNQTPYTDRTISRTNTWRWNKGRTVFELVAPGGDVYVMQSYAQIKDPTLSLAQLRSLGRRLMLPSGWRYRARTLDHGLVLTAKGSATITQDDLQNTYQLATTTHRGSPTRRSLSITGRTHTVPNRAVPPPPPGTVEDHGTVSGTPFGNGSIVLVGTLATGRLTGTFRLVFPQGSIAGNVSMPFTISGGKISFRGTARLVSGTGAYRGISSGELQVRDTNTVPDGQSGRLSVQGSATY
jgi:hypothetical protein